MAELTENDKCDNLTLAGILKAQKGELEKLAHDCNLEVTPKTSRHELQALLIEHMQILSQGGSVPLSPSPEPAPPSPSPSVEEMRLRELELNERRLKFEMEN